MYVTGPFLAVELDSGLLLAEEGLEQRHCIGTYANACASGATRVFSLRHNGRRAATIELQRGHDGAWHMVQIRGKANTAIHAPTLLDAAGQLTQAYSEAEARAREIRDGSRAGTFERHSAALATRCATGVLDWLDPVHSAGRSELTPTRWWLAAWNSRRRSRG